MKYHGTSAWVMAGGYVSAALGLLSVFFDHYDKRDNERSYRRFQAFAIISTVALSLLAMMMDAMGVD
ncbi:MAG: hypothetical protein HY735_34780 [Verrucomicrobia bacterium]|nr:hypothetical protein [Verrucomicrobiota bacterium]